MSSLKREMESLRKRVAELEYAQNSEYFYAYSQAYKKWKEEHKNELQYYSSFYCGNVSGPQSEWTRVDHHKALKAIMEHLGLELVYSPVKVERITVEKKK